MVEIVIENSCRLEKSRHTYNYTIMNIIKVFSLFLICVITGCSSKKTTPNFNIEPTSTKEYSIENVFIDTLRLDSIVTSFEIESSINNDKIYLVDKYFNYIYEYNTMGNVLNRYLGTGRARNETTIGQIATHTFLDDGLFLLNQSGAYYYYDKHYNFKDMFIISYVNQEWNRLNIYEIPQAYTQRYSDIVCRQYEGNVYFNVHLAHEQVNIISSTKEHLRKNANILEINSKMHDFGRLLAVGYPKSYYEDTYNKAIMSSVNFDIDKKGTFYVTYEADSLIYVYDKDFTMLKCYGFAGRDMDLDYTLTTTPKEVGKNYRTERNTKGYYNWLEYVDETGVLFRSYKKGEKATFDGLQIYKNGVMIGDIDVPKGFKLLGYIKPYYYSHIIADDKKETLTIYKLKYNFQE